MVALTAFVGSQLAGALHSAVERHAICAEHGEIIHLSNHDPGDAAGLDSAGSPAAAVVLADHVAEARPAAPAPADDAHEHCDLCPTSRERIAPAAQTAHDKFRATLPRAAAPSVRLHASASDLYILAPKNSPPA